MILPHRVLNILGWRRCPNRLLQPYEIARRYEGFCCDRSRPRCHRGSGASRRRCRQRDPGAGWDHEAECDCHRHPWTFRIRAPSARSGRGTSSPESHVPGNDWSDTTAGRGACRSCSLSTNPVCPVDRIRRSMSGMNCVEVADKRALATEGVSPHQCVAVGAMGRGRPLPTDALFANRRALHWRRPTRIAARVCEAGCPSRVSGIPERQRE
jgi:hypothetical protein